MPISHVLDRAGQRLLTRAEGLVTFDEIKHHLDLEAVERGLELPELVDARGATTSVTADQVRQLVARTHATGRSLPLGPTAIVTDSDHLFGMARMYAILAEPIGAPVEVFRDIDAALAWLDGWIEMGPHD